MDQPLHAPLEISFDYTRSLGPTLGAFVTALAERRILGARGQDGRVHSPPFEYDPVTGAPPADFVEVGPAGSVVSWTWTDRPLDGQPLKHPFGWALIRLDGADTTMLHAVDVATADQIRTGMRVAPRWSERTGSGITDIACFEPEAATAQGTESRASAHTTESRASAQATEATGVGTTAPGQPIAMITAPIRLSYDHTVSPGESAYLLALADGRLLGQRCPVCGKVYLPPRGACPVDGVPTRDEVQLPDTGIVTTFCVVNVPFQGQQFPSPYVAASVLIDGADIPFQHLILGCQPDEVRMGMRVRAVWKPQSEWDVGHNIDHFEPTGEPDAPYESFSHHL